MDFRAFPTLKNRYWTGAGTYYLLFPFVRETSPGDEISC
jgi:hypothetical protein